MESMKEVVCSSCGKVVTEYVTIPCPDGKFVVRCKECRRKNIPYKCGDMELP